MIGEAGRNRTYLLEGYMYRFHPRTRMILDVLRDGAIGEVLAVEASYGFRPGPRPLGGCWTRPRAVAGSSTSGDTPSLSCG